MDYEKATLVCCITLFLVVGVNAAIYVSLADKRTIGQIELFRRATNRAQKPWGEEDQTLQELSRKVAELKEQERNG